MVQKRTMLVQAAMIAAGSVSGMTSHAEPVAEVAPSANQETINSAIDSVLRKNPRILLELNRGEIARESLVQARSALFPQVNMTTTGGAGEIGSNRTVGAGFNPAERPFSDYSFNRATVGLEARQSLYSGGTRGASIKQARNGVEAADADILSVVQDLIFQTSSAYVDVRTAEAEIDIRKQNVSALETQLNAARDRFRVGEVTRTDVAQAEARLSGAIANEASAQATLQAARAIFFELVGRPAMELTDQGAFPLAIETLEEAFERARENSPLLIAARADLEAARQAVKSVKGRRRPQVDLIGSAGYQVEYIDDQLRDQNYEVIANARLPLYQGGLLASQVRSAKLDENNALLQLRATERAVISTISRTWYAVSAADEAIRASLRQVEAAEVAYNGAEQELAAGLRSTLDVLDQEQELLEARLRLVQAQRQAYLARAELSAAMGDLTPDRFGVNIPLSSPTDYP